MERVPPILRHLYESDFNLADASFFDGRVAATTITRVIHWKNWTRYVLPLGVDIHLQDTPFHHRVRALSGFAARVRSGYFGRGRQVAAGTVSSALSAIGTTIALAIGTNPTKLGGTGDKLLPRLQQMLDGFRATDPPTLKKLPIEVDVVELLVGIGMEQSATPCQRATGDLALIAFYYLLRVGEYTAKGSRRDSKRTVQFKLEDVTFFKKDKRGQLLQLPNNALFTDILSADSATLKLENQKNGWKGVCIHQETNGDPILCPVRALGRRVFHLRENTPLYQPKLTLSAYFANGQRFDTTDNDI